jgi:ATP-dependent Clp protease ATP-binding subunit ClpX
MNADKKHLNCNFCGQPEVSVKKLIAGPDVAICDSCITLCNEMLQDKPSESLTDVKKTLTPKEIFAELNRFVIGQDDAKKTLAIAVYNHYQRTKITGDDNGIRKSNILMVGPTGCGKTMLAETLAKVMNVPIAISDATTLTESGYVGDDVENVVKKLLQMCDFDIERAEKGIVFIDEIDKIGRRSENPSITRDVGGEGVQQSLLKLMEGSEITIPAGHERRKKPGEETITINTKNILFICGGAFSGIEKIVSAKNEVDSSRIGFGATVKSKELRKRSNPLLNIEQDDLIKFGLIPEFIGRLPVIAELQELDSDLLVRVLVEPEDSLVSEYKRLFELSSVQLEFEPNALIAIAEQADSKNIGARGLRSIMESILKESMFTAPSDENLVKIIVTEETVRNKTQPEFQYKIAA